MDYKTARKSMVDCQVRPSDISNNSLIDAMLAIPREIFLPTHKRSVAYTGEHLHVESGRYILDPRIFSKMVEALDVRPTDYILDVGNATGYSTAVLSRLGQTIIGIEESDSLMQLAEQNLQAISCDNTIVKSGALSEGLKEHAPYDAILINGTIAQKPEALLEQLHRDHGRLVTLRIGENGSYCELWRRDQDSYSSQRLFDASAPILVGFTPEPTFTF